MNNSELLTEACVLPCGQGKTAPQSSRTVAPKTSCPVFSPTISSKSKRRSNVRVDLYIKKKEKKNKIQTHRRRDAFTRQSTRRPAIDHSADELIIPHLKPTVSVKAPVTTARSCCFFLPPTPTNPPTNWKTCCLHTEAEFPCSHSRHATIRLGVSRRLSGRPNTTDPNPTEPPQDPTDPDTFCPSLQNTSSNLCRRYEAKKMFRRWAWLTQTPSRTSIRNLDKYILGK